jgi:hypothetical protein
VIFYGEIFPSHYFIYHDKHYKIVKGHEEIIRFPGKPFKDPYDGMTDKEVDASDKKKNKKYKAFTKYLEYDDEFRKDFRFHPSQGHEIVELCKKAGYKHKKDEWLDFWLVDRAAKMIEKKKLQDF